MSARAAPEASAAAEAAPPARLYWPCVALVAVAALLVIWVPAYVPGQDTPAHLFAAQVWATPAPFDAYFTRNWALTSQLFATLASVFVPLGLQVAGKIVRTLGLGVLGAGYLLAGTEAGSRRPLGLLVGLAASASFYHAMGFESFALATALGVLSTGLALRAVRRGDPPSYLALGACLLLTAHAHSVACGMICLELLVLAALLPAQGAAVRWRRAGMVIASAAPAALLSFYAAWRSAAGAGDRGDVPLDDTLRLPLVEQAINVARCSFGGFSSFAALLVVVVIGWTLWSCRRASATGALGKVAPLASLALWAAIYLAVPFHGHGWAYAQPRVLIMLVLVPAAFLPWGGASRPLAVGATLCAVAHLLASLVGAMRASDLVERQVRSFGSAPAGRTIVVVGEPGSTDANPYALPLLSAGLYGLTSGGGSPLVLGFNPAVHIVLLQPPRERWPPWPPPFLFRGLDCRLRPDCEGQWASLVDSVAVQGMAYDTVLFIGTRQAFLEGLSRRGYSSSPETPNRFVARPGKIVVRFRPPAAAEQAALRIVAGYPETVGWIAGRQRPPGPIVSEETLALAPVPAGPITIAAQLVRAPQPDAPGPQRDPETVFSQRVEVPAGKTVTLALEPE